MCESLATSVGCQGQSGERTDPGIKKQSIMQKSGPRCVSLSLSSSSRPCLASAVHQCADPRPQGFPAVVAAARMDLCNDRHKHPAACQVLHPSLLPSHWTGTTVTMVVVLKVMSRTCVGFDSKVLKGRCEEDAAVALRLFLCFPWLKCHFQPKRDPHTPLCCPWEMGGEQQFAILPTRMAPRWLSCSTQTRR